MNNWLDKYEQGGMVLKQKTKDNYGKKANPNNPDVSLPPGFKGLAYNTKGRNYSPAWGGQFQMGGSLPGAVGFTYARTAGAAPANGPYAKKTKASAQNGKEMKFYQAGLDFKPKNISQDGSEIPVDPMGYWNPDNVGNPVIIPSNEITMEGVDQPLIGISDTGDVQYMYPGEDYTFDGESVTEYPVAQKGISVSAPTTADSLKVYNAAVKMMDYYRNDKRHAKPEIDVYDPKIEKSTVSDVGYKNVQKYREMYKELSDPNLESFKTSEYERDYKLPKQEILKKVAKAIAESKSAAPGTAYYKDAYPSKIDINAPSAYIDSRISPQGFVNYRSSVNLKGRYDQTEPAGSVTGLWYYDPLAVKPYNMRTPKEREDWEKKYGKPKSVAKSTPKKEQPTKQVEKPSTPVVKTTPPAASPIIEKRQNIYEGSPVYSPGAGIGMGSALIGFLGQKGDTTYIKPEDYERFAVPKYGKQFIESKKKQRNGGVNKADEYPIEKLDQSLNFTNYNKPTKGGWLDKYN
jgi:hypothetical protein